MTCKKRIGILTGGGDCPGLNAVIRAFVKGAIHEHDFEVIGFEDGYLGLMENRYRVLNDQHVSGILTQGGTILGTSNKANPFAASENKKGDISSVRDVPQECIETLNKLSIECMVCIGGDGTLSIADRFASMGVNVIGVPKTIDNDLCETDMTFGFDSAVQCAAEAIDRLHTTAQSHHRVMVIELMGRYAGWITLCAGLAGGGDVILIPEIPFDIEKICQKVRDRNKKGKRFSIIVVAEGAHEKGKDRIVKSYIKDSPDPVRLGGVGDFVAHSIEKQTGIETRCVVLGHLQRGGVPTSFDRILGTRFGYYALQMAVNKRYGVMVALKGAEIVPVALKDAVSRIKTVPLDSPLIQMARSVGACMGD